MLKKDVKNIVLIQLPILLLFFQYQINWLYEDSVLRHIFNVVTLFLVALFLLKNINIKFIGTFLFLVCVIGTALLGSMIKAPAIALLFVFGYCSVIRADKSLNQILCVILILNGIVILLQLLGVGALVYKFQFFSPNSESTFSNFLNGENGYLPDAQARPPGIFPSTIYLSVFQCLIFGQLIASATYGRKIMKFLTGGIFALTGSTTSTLFFLFSFIFGIRKKQLVYFQCGFLSGLAFLYLVFSSIYAENYTFEGKLSRFQNRLIMDGGHSVLTDNFSHFIMLIALVGVLICGLGFYLKKRDKFNFLSIFIFSIVCLTPVIIHVILEDIRYWFIVGTACGQLISASAVTPGQVIDKNNNHLINMNVRNKLFGGLQ